MTYISEPLSRMQLREIALFLRKMVGYENHCYFPIVPFLEYIMPREFKEFQYEIVPKSAFPKTIHADIDVIHHCIRIREDIYYGAVNGCGRDRMTIAHEIAHYILMVVCGVKFNRNFEKKSIPAYQDTEWQAKALAGELMCAAHLIQNMEICDIVKQCGVSEAAAKYHYQTCRKVV